MTLLLWYCCLALCALMLAALPNRKVVGRPAAAEADQPCDALAIPQEVEAPARPSTRAAVQTSAAIMAIALSLDVSATQSWTFAPEPVSAEVVQPMTFAEEAAPLSFEVSWASSGEGGWVV